MILKVFIVEDHDVMREAITDRINQDPDLEVCGAAANASETMDRLPTCNPDLVMIDVSLPGMSGLDLLETLLDRDPNMRCLILSGHSEAGYIKRAFDLGSRGYVIKGVPAEINEALLQVAAGGTYLSASARRRFPKPN